MSAIAGTNVLVRLASRRDRIVLPAWFYVLVALTLGTEYSFKGLYPTLQGRESFAATITADPTLQAMVGPLFSASTIGGLTAWRIGSLGGTLLAVMNIIVVVRHTRQEEEAGRLELVGAGAVGRYAPLTAGLVLALAADLLIGLVIAGGMVAIGEAPGGSFALGLALAGVGAVFAGVAAVTAQLAETSRAAIGIAVAVLGAVFLLRAIGDAAPNLSWLAWLSPIGWGEQVRPFADTRLWAFALPVVATALLCAVAMLLVGHRDLGAGLLASRSGPATAGPYLRGPLALAWRLNRGVCYGWLAGYILVGGVIGAATKDMMSVFNSSTQMQRIVAQLGGASGMADALLSAMLQLFGLISAAFMIQVVLRLRSEETSQRVEPVLATGVGRTRLATAHLAVAAVAGAALMVAFGLFAGLGYGLRDGDVGTQLPRVLAAAAAQVPAAWVVAAIAIALFGLVPELAQVAWAVLVVSFLLGQLGPTLRLPQWLLDVSPFTHAPKLPVHASGAAIGWLLVVSAVLVVAGLAGFRRRDVG